MEILKKIDSVANLWEKTKDPKYKELWYKYIREFANGPNNIKRWNIPLSGSNKRNDQRNKIIK